MKKALILIDIQNDYFKDGNMPLFESEKTVINAQKLLQQFRQNNDLVVHIQHISTREDAHFFIADTDGVQIHQQVAPIATERVIIKHYPNSFRDTELLDFLTEHGIKKLVIVGMMTHMCVDATVRAGKDLGFDIEVIADACTTKDLEIFGKKVKATDVQTAFLSALNYFYADIL